MINLRDEFLDSFIDTEEALKAKLQEVIANKAERQKQRRDYVSKLSETKVRSLEKQLEI